MPPRRNRSVRNKCSRCRVFIPQSSTLCASCASSSAEVTHDNEDSSSVSIPNEDNPRNIVYPPRCTLCGLHEQSQGQLCCFCCPVTLPVCTDAECQKCRRITCSSLNSISMTDVKQTAFGCRLPGETSDFARLCNECSHYTTHGFQSPWRIIWPCVVLDFLRGKYNGVADGKPFHKVLPTSILKQYQHLLQINTDEKETVFADLTHKLQEFTNLKEELKIEGLQKAHNKYCFPEVRCPFGCTEFVGDTGLIPLQFFLQMLDQNFAFNKIKWKRRLRCVRPDWLCSYNHNDVFNVRPHIVIDEKQGLCLATCKFHNGGSHQFFVHPPTNPTGRLPSKNADRLGPATVSYNCYKPSKPNFSTHTFSMGVAKGSFSGISSTTIACKRRWDIAFGEDDVVREALCSNNRLDIKPLLQQLVNKGEISQNLFDSITSNEGLPDDQTVLECLKTATSVPFELALALKKIQEEGISVNYFPVFSQPFTKHGCDPPDTVVNTSMPKHLWLYAVMFAVSCNFHLSLLKFIATDTSLKDIFPLMLNNDGRLVAKKKRELAEFLQSQPQDPSYDMVDSLQQLLSTISFVKHFNVTDRGSVESNLKSLTDEKIVTFITNARRRDDGYLPDRVVTTNSSTTYELRSIAILEGGNVKTIVRHGNEYNCWWIYSTAHETPTKMKLEDLVEMSHFHSNWMSCHYEVIGSVDMQRAKYQYLEYLGGQGRFICDDHHVPLTVARNGTPTLCSFSPSCQRKPAWNCPSENCLSSVCRTHFRQHQLSNEHLFVKCPTSNNEVVRSQPAESCDDDDDEVVSEPESEYDEFSFTNFTTDAGHVDNMTNCLATDSGDMPSVVDSIDTSIPAHILLNTDCHVLERKNYRNDRSKTSSRFLQNIVASSGNSIPLIYPDAALFPTHYYHEQTDNTITGAVPAPLFCDKQSKHFLFASIEDHKRSAVLNPNLLQSTDVRSIQTSFDTVLNKRLTFSDTRLVLIRGFQEVTVKTSKSITPNNPKLQFDQADSRVRVNELAAMLSKEPATFFLTLTCNQKNHFGVAPIFEAIENRFNRIKKEEYERAVQAEMVLLTRAWYRSAEALMEWIEKSPDQPLGTVTKIWYRYEFQSTKGNLPHIHCVIWTKESKAELQHKVSCSGSSALFELKKIAAETNVINCDQVFDLWTQLMTIQTHSCEKANYRCHKIVKDDGSTICRVPRYPHSNQYSWRKVPSSHSEEALQVLHYLDLATPSKSHDDTFDVSDSLQGGKFEYPASSDEHLSPFNPLIFVATMSSQNLQLCDEYLSARYIAKYAAGIEERADARVDPVSFNEIRVHTKGINNSKISSCRIKEKSTDRKTIVQIIPLVETVWWLLNFKYVNSSVSFVHLSTLEKSERPSFIIPGKNTNPSQPLPAHVTKSFSLPLSRQFTQSQLLVLKDSMTSEHSNCKMTIFSGRPPALLCVDNPQLYFTWFNRVNIRHPEDTMKLDVNISKWIDVFGRAVHLRRCYLDEFSAHVTKLRREGHNNLYRFDEDTSILFLQNDSLGLKTIDDTPVQVVTSNIVPSNRRRFLVHFVLSNGKFETEPDLFNHLSMLEVFINCKLLPLKSSYTIQDACDLVKFYVLTELKYLPGASRSFDRHLLSCYELITNLVLNNQIHTEALPSTLHSELTENAEIAYILHSNEKRERSVQGCLLNPALMPLQPHNDSFVAATRSNPFVYNFPFPRAPGQSDESNTFQQRVFNGCIQKLTNFIETKDGFIKHQLFLGRPGSGKTLICTMIYLEAVAKGLNCAITCLSGERAQQLGGEHVHKLFKFRVNKFQNPELMASQSLKSLLKDVTRFTELERLDVLFIDEVGQLNSELMIAMEIVLQTVRDNKLPMGGVFTILTGDPKQLRPPQGSLTWLSPKMLTNFDFHYFRHYVRAKPGLLREILTKMDEIDISPIEASSIAKEIVANCNIHSTWDDIGDNFDMRVFSTRAAEKQAVTHHFEKILADQSCAKVVFTANDEESSTGSSIWRPAGDIEQKFIDSTSITPRQLLLYKKALLRFTANLPNIQARQGQLCLILEIPTETASSLDVWIAPPGCRTAANFDENNLITSGWRKVSISKVFTPVMTNQCKFLRRYSFPLKNYVASTIHKCIGDTFPKIVTKVSLTDKHYKIWEKEQLLVLLSRVSKLDDITFVGEEHEIELTLTAAIQQKSCWGTFINDLLEKLASTPSDLTPPTLNLLSSNVVPWNIVLPEDNVGFVYLLISTKIPNAYCIGEALEIRRELKLINSGNGASETRPIERRPWAIVAFATGFNTEDSSGNNTQRKSLVSKMRTQFTSLGINFTTVELFETFKESTRTYADERDLNLRVIQCASV